MFPFCLVVLPAILGYVTCWCLHASFVICEPPYYCWFCCGLMPAPHAFLSVVPLSPCVSPVSCVCMLAFHLLSTMPLRSGDLLVLWDHCMYWCCASGVSTFGMGASTWLFVCHVGWRSKPENKNLKGFFCGSAGEAQLWGSWLPGVVDARPWHLSCQMI